LTVGFHSPLPPARTGVADYAAALLTGLRPYGTVRVNSWAADVNLYHLGNNPLHREVYGRALARPGVVVLHDAVLHHFFLGALNRAGYIEEFVFNYGEWGRGLAEDLWAARSHSGAEERFFRYPMLRRIAETSRAVIVHNPAAARMVREHAPHARVHEIPHLLVPPTEATPAEIRRLRAVLGIDARTSVFSVLGFLRESKRLPVILKAFVDIRRRGVPGTLLVAGEFVSPDLARVIAPLMNRPDVRYFGAANQRSFWLRAAACDACINLRHPTAGETSGVTIRLMGMGKPVLVTESGEVSRFPAAVCLRVDPGIAEKDELVQYMVMLAQSGGTAREIGRQAAAYVREKHSLGTVARSYWEVLCAARN
jgi:glycosyltransferase involved in cell wall biosynthesis